MEFDEIRQFLARQAAWSSHQRRYLYRKVGLRRRSRVLDAGCGPGDVTVEIAGLARGEVTGVDIDPEMVEHASRAHPGVTFVEADCARLPFPGGSFDLVATHFVFMWLGDLEKAVREMVRVLAPGGILLASAEPDYGGLVEYPEHTEFSGAVTSALERAGADPLAGRKLAPALRSAGLGVRQGVSATPWEGETLRVEFEARKDMYLRDLTSVLGEAGAGRVLADEAAMVARGKMVMVPLFWALGYKL